MTLTSQSAAEQTLLLSQNEGGGPSRRLLPPVLFCRRPWSHARDQRAALHAPTSTIQEFSASYRSSLIYFFRAGMLLLVRSWFSIMALCRILRSLVDSLDIMNELHVTFHIFLPRAHVISTELLFGRHLFELLPDLAFHSIR